jgi:hypothetical protein
MEYNLHRNFKHLHLNYILFLYISIDLFETKKLDCCLI